MKTIKLKDYSNGGMKATTQSMLSQIIDHSGANGITTSEQRKRIKLLDILDAEYEKGSDEIQLEDADYSYLISLVDGMTWAISNSIVRQFIKDFS